MKIRRTLFLLLTLLLLSACKPNQNEEFIQGAWVLADKPGSAYLLWEFNNGAFAREQEIDKGQINFALGRYRILNSDEDSLTLELFDITGERFTYENNDIELTILIDRRQDTIQISSDLFERASP